MKEKKICQWIWIGPAMLAIKDVQMDYINFYTPIIPPEWLLLPQYPIKPPSSSSPTTGQHKKPMNPVKSATARRLKTQKQQQ